jgi:hypothetical protein
MTITSKYEGKCRNCGGAVHVGDSVEWTKGQKGVAHAVCPDNPETPAFRQPSAKQLYWLVAKLREHGTDQEKADFKAILDLDFDAVSTLLDDLFKRGESEVK